MLTTPLVGASIPEDSASGVTPNLRFERPYRASLTGLLYKPYLRFHVIDRVTVSLSYTLTRYSAQQAAARHC
eukprot:6212268-Pleurochrysis_carterae.AAC.2